MEVEEEPLSCDDDLDIDNSFISDKEDEIYLQNKLEERVILNQEMISELNKEIGKLKNLYPEHISHPLSLKIVNHVSYPENKSQTFLDENITPPKNDIQCSTDVRDSKYVIGYSAGLANHWQQNTSLDFDEMPVKKLSCSFQEHLDNVMKKFDSQHQLMSVEQKLPRTRLFLRKGQGLQRYENKKRVKESDAEKQHLNFSDKTLQPNDNKSKTKSDVSANSTATIFKVSNTKTATLPLKKLIVKKTLQRKTSLPTNLKNKSPSKSKVISSSQNNNNANEVVLNSKISNKIQGSRERNFGPDETQPLIEFEILEGLAMDDASFLSSVSTVDRVLQMHHGFHPVNNKTELQRPSEFEEVSPEKNLCKSSKTNGSEGSFDLKLTTTQTLNSNYLEGNVKSFDKEHKDMKHLDDNIVVFDVKRKTSTISGMSKEEQTELPVNSDEVSVQRGAYVPSLYAASGNDDTFSSDIGSIREDGFGDNSSWNDDNLMEEKQRKDAFRDKIRNSLNVPSNLNHDHSNRSQMPLFVNKIFPASNCMEFKESIPKEVSSNQIKISGDVIHSKLLRERILELEVEMERYKREHAALTQTKKEHSKLVVSFNKEVEELKKKKKLDEQEFEKLKNEEMQKLKKEKKIFEMYKKSHEDLYYAREEKKVQEGNLKSDLEKLREDVKVKEQRWKANSERMKDRIDRLEKENLDLKERLFSKEQEFLKIKIQPQASKKSHDRCSLDWGYLKNIKASSIPNPPCLVQPAVEIITSDGPAHNICKYNMQNPRDVTDLDICDREFRDVIATHLDMPDGSIKASRVVKKVKNADGSDTIVFNDGDVQQNFADGSKLYIFTEHNIHHYTYPDGLQIFNFPCGQIEKIFADGNKEIVFPNGNLKYIYSDGSKETILQDGTVIKVQTDDTIIKELVNGIKEIYCNDTRKIEYQDGTIKIIYKDGSQETRYASGRVRMKDSHGNLTFDGL